MEPIKELLHLSGVSQVGSEHHHVRNGWIGIDCPYCSPGRYKYRLGIEISSGRCNCWNCGTQNGPKILSEVTSQPLAKCIALWKEVFKNKHLFKEKYFKKTGTLKLPTGMTDLTDPHRKYLADRGFDPDELARLWGLKSTQMDSDLPWRIIIPVHNAHGKIVSWTSRALHNEGTRYQTARAQDEDYPLKWLIYGAHLIRSTIVLVEGPADAWAIGPGAGATLGIAYTSQQMALLSKYTRRIICFDSSSDAQKRARVLARQMAPFPGTTQSVKLSTGDDPADADKEEIEELRQLFLE